MVVRGSIQMDILESLWNQSSSMGVVAAGNDLFAEDVHVIGAFQIHLERHLRGKIEIGVEGAGAVTRPHRLRRRELVDIVGTGAHPVQAFLDTIAFGANLRESQVDFSHNPSNIEPAGISNAAVILGLKPRADDRKAII